MRRAGAHRIRAADFSTRKSPKPRAQRTREAPDTVGRCLSLLPNYAPFFRRPFRGFGTQRGALFEKPHPRARTLLSSDVDVRLDLVLDLLVRAETVTVSLSSRSDSTLALFRQFTAQLNLLLLRRDG